MAVAVIMKLRLDKYLTEMGCGTRSQVKKEILKGSVSVNGEIAKKAERKVDTEKDEIIFKGEKIFYAGYEYFMLNKPAGVVSATEDKKERTVIDLIKESKRKDLFPAGRLDKDTEGLLLITNDGQLAHRLLSPKKHVDKIYYAKIKGIVTEEDVRLFEKGVHIGDEKPCHLCRRTTSRSISRKSRRRLAYPRQPCPVPYPATGASAQQPASACWTM